MKELPGRRKVSMLTGSTSSWSLSRESSRWTRKSIQAATRWAKLKFDKNSKHSRPVCRLGFVHWFSFPSASTTLTPGFDDMKENFLIGSDGEIFGGSRMFEGGSNDLRWLHILQQQQSCADWVHLGGGRQCAQRQAARGLSACLLISQLGMRILSRITLRFITRSWQLRFTMKANLVPEYLCDLHGWSRKRWVGSGGAQKRNSKSVFASLKIVKRRDWGVVDFREGNDFVGFPYQKIERKSYYREHRWGKMLSASRSWLADQGREGIRKLYPITGFSQPAVISITERQATTLKWRFHHFNVVAAHADEKISSKFFGNAENSREDEILMRRMSEFLSNAIDACQTISAP